MCLSKQNTIVAISFVSPPPPFCRLTTLTHYQPKNENKIGSPVETKHYRHILCPPQNAFLFFDIYRNLYLFFETKLYCRYFVFYFKTHLVAHSQPKTKKKNKNQKQNRIAGVPPLVVHSTRVGTQPHRVPPSQNATHTVSNKDRQSTDRPTVVPHNFSSSPQLVPRILRDLLWTVGWLVEMAVLLLQHLNLGVLLSVKLLPPPPRINTF